MIGQAAKREMIMDLATGRLRPVVASAPITSSANGGWNGFLLERHRAGQVEVDQVCCLNHVFFVHLGRPISFEWRVGDGWGSIHMEPGHLNFMPACVAHGFRSAAAGEFITLSMQEPLLKSVAAEVGVPRFELQPKFGVDDPLVREILVKLEAETTTSDADGRLYVETLIDTLAFHTLRHYSVERPKTEPVRGGLAKPQLRQVFECIEARLHEDLSLKDLASVADLSAFHFARQFKRTTGQTPYAYLTDRRVERARELLLRRKFTVADVAAQVGFYDQSHLARRFRDRFGTSPGDFLRRSQQRRNVL